MADDDSPSIGSHPEWNDEELASLLAAIVQEFEVDDGGYRFTISGLKSVAEARDIDVSRKTIENWLGKLNEASFVQEGEYEAQRGVVYFIDRELLDGITAIQEQGLQSWLNNAGVSWCSSEYFETVRKLQRPATAADTLREIHRRGRDEDTGA